jgi:hypothetical protein
MTPTALTADLIAAYLRTTYWVETPLEAIPLRVGEFCSTLSTSMAPLAAEFAAVMTTCNPRSAILPPCENRRRQAAFEEELRNAGFRFWPALGVGVDPGWYPEPSICILQPSREELRKWLVDWDQHATVWYDATSIPTLVFQEESVAGEQLGLLLETPLPLDLEAKARYVQSGLSRQSR